ncbi:MAG: glycosyltransferase [Anaerolineae bacterium]|nr:glycosyltransferase [Anaerolineae bacterium]
MDLLTSVLFWLVGLFLLWRVPTIAGRRTVSATDLETCYRVSVVIPARNEALRVPTLLRSLQQQALIPHEVIVVDDDSSDDTAAVARALGATVIGAGERPPGWLGKPWACWRGAQQATGNVLLFLDADTWLEPQALADLLSAYRARGGMVSVQPYHVTYRAYEQLSLFFNIVLMVGVNAFTPLGHRLSPTGAFGPCILCSREDYLSVGGHAAARGEILEDIILARRFSERGCPISSYGGRGSVSFRMYSDGFASMISGWSKGFAQGSTYIRPSFLLLSIAWVSGCFGAFVRPLMHLPFEGTQQVLAHAAVYLLYAAQVLWMARRIGRFQPWAGLLFPLPLAFFGLIMLRSLVLRYVLRRAVWKDRVIQLGGGG